MQRTRSPSTQAHAPRSCTRRRRRRILEPFWWARKAGLPLFSSHLFPPAGSSGHRERARAALLPHLQHRLVLHAPSSRAKAKSCLGERNPSERGSPSRSTQGPGSGQLCFSLRSNQGKPSEVLAMGELGKVGAAPPALAFSSLRSEIREPGPGHSPGRQQRPFMPL